MNLEAMYQQQRKGFIKSSTIVLLAFATAYFARLIEALGVPAAINFLHFATVPLACSVVLAKARSKSQRQLAIVQEILLGLLIFFILMCASGLLNNAGLLTRALNSEQARRRHKQHVSRERSSAQREVDVVCYVNSCGDYQSVPLDFLGVVVPRH